MKKQPTSLMDKMMKAMNAHMKDEMGYALGGMVSDIAPGSIDLNNPFGRAAIPMGNSGADLNNPFGRYDASKPQNMMQLQQSVQQRSLFARDKALTAAGFIKGGTIPGKVNPSTGDDTTINAKKGEYILPIAVVDAIGKDKLDALVAQITGQMPNNTDNSNFDGGYINGQLQIPQIGNSLDPSNASVIGKALHETTQPGYAAPAPTPNYNIPGLANAQQIGATINNGNNEIPVYNPSQNPTLGSPLTAAQSQALGQAWQQEWANQKPTQPIQVSYQAPGVVQGNPGAKTIALVSPGQNGQMPEFYHPAGVAIPAGLSPEQFAQRAGDISAVAQNSGLIPDKDTMVNKITGQPISATPAGQTAATFGQPFETMIGGKKYLFQQGSDGKLHPLGSDTSTTVKLNVNAPSTDEASSMAQSIIEGKLDPYAISKRGGLQSKVFAMVRGMNSDFNFTKASADAKYARNDNINRSVAILDSITPLLEELKQSHTDLNFTQYPAANKAKRVWLEQTGDKRITAYDNLRNNIILETTNAMQGSSQMSDARVKMEQENLQKAQSPEQMTAAIDNIRKIIGARKEAFRTPPFGQGNKQSPQPNAAPKTAKDYLNKWGQ